MATTHITSPLNVALVDGAAAGDVTVAGITANDELVSVTSLASASDVLSTADLTDEFSITDADTINNAIGTSSANGALLVIWIAKSPYGV